MDLDQISVGKFGAGIGVIPMPASSSSFPATTELGGEVRKTSTAPTANTLKFRKRPAKQALPPIRPAVAICGLRAIVSNNAVREKALQSATLETVRSMRAVFCWTLRQEIVLLAVLPSTDLDHSPPEPPRTLLKLRREASTTRGPNDCGSGLNRLVHTPWSDKSKAC